MFTNETHAPGTSPPTATPCKILKSNSKTGARYPVSIVRQQPNSQGGQRHEKNAESEHLFATAQVSHMRHNYATERSGKITAAKMPNV